MQNDAKATIKFMRRKSAAEADTSFAGRPAWPAEAIKAVVFDAPGVLFDPTTGRRRLWRMLSSFGIARTYDEFFDIWQRDYLQDVHCGRQEYAEALDDFLHSQGLTAGQIDEVQAAIRVRQRVLEAGERALPGVNGALLRIERSGVRLAALADVACGGDEFVEQLAQLALARFFEVVVASRDLQATQPEPATYAGVLERLNLPVGEVAYAGRCAAHLTAAAAMGLRTVGIGTLSGADDTWHIPHISQLANLLDRDRGMIRQAA